MSDLAARRERSRRLLWILSERVGEVCSRELRTWGPLWEIVREPSERLLEVVADWEKTGEERLMDRAKELSLEVLAVWKEAERQYQDARNREEVTA